MQNFDYLVNLLKNEILQLPNAKINAANTWISMRCPYCGDSLRNTSGAHFGISVPATPKSPIIKNCFRIDCDPRESRGSLTAKDLRYLGIYNSDLAKFVTELNKNKSDDIDYGYKKYNYKNVNLPSRDNAELNELNNKKLNYINNRLGLNLTFEDLDKYKIVLDIESFLELNNIKHRVFDNNMMRILSEDGIGFLSADNSHVIIRNMGTRLKSDMRYINYRIVNSPEAKKYIVIPCKVDLLDIEPIDIHISEGFFDIFSIYHNYTDNKGIHIAGCGCSFDQILRQLINNGLTVNCNINIYSDSDVSHGKYINLIKYIGRHRINGDINIFYNSASDDHGVPKEKLKPVNHISL